MARALAFLCGLQATLGGIALFWFPENFVVITSFIARKLGLSGVDSPTDTTTVLGGAILLIGLHYFYAAFSNNKSFILVMALGKLVFSAMMIFAYSNESISSGWLLFVANDVILALLILLSALLSSFSSHKKKN